MTTSEVCTRYIESDNPAGEIVWMARQSGCKPSEIIYVLNCCGLETPMNIPDECEAVDRDRDRERIFTPDLDVKIMELRNSGLLPSKISEQVGIDARRISHRLHILKRRKEAGFIGLRSFTTTHLYTAIICRVWKSLHGRCVKGGIQLRRIKFDAAKFCMEGMDGWLMLRVPTRYRMPARALVQEIAPDKLYDAEIKRHRQKRSLDANAYFWLLCGKLAAITGIPKNEIYQQYICEIGDNFEIVPVRSDAAKQWKKIWESRGEGWLCISLGTSKLAGYINLCCYYGSSTYDAKQMSRMIDLIVQDCKDQGIETAPPDEIALMKARWADALDDKGV
ncbi:hypothetical protein [Anaerotruncus colihominis]|uniref:hypothetical protein n=1 Tax=Anaerotruncus colihominis TaxID=169435 RepID=UPI0035171D78